MFAIAYSYYKQKVAVAIRHISSKTTLLLISISSHDIFILLMPVLIDKNMMEERKKQIISQIYPEQSNTSKGSNTKSNAEAFARSISL
jgi:hypothetical protein